MKYIRRFMWFIASRALVVTIVASILVCAFYMSMNSANIYIVLTDGLRARVETILTAAGAESLNDYFHAEFLNHDSALQGAFDGSSAFGAYDIQSFDYVLSIESLWAWPWDDVASCTVTERVPSITGSVLSSRRDEVDPEVPAWQGGRYSIALARSAGKWKITGMRQIGIIIEPTPVPAPTEEAP
ncbi:MAG: hypothetical protein ACOYI5_10420 [Christensenellales bacterium]|jgi:hypothetical protein